MADGVTDAQATAQAWLRENRDRFSADHMHLWRLAEPAWREYRSAAWFVDRLRCEGFEVEAGTAGMPTAFKAIWRNGAGPVLANIAEYDAVPGMSQEPLAERRPREGTHRHAAGHTDPHSALGIAALAGTLAAKHAMERHGIGGTLVLMGEPAEKMCGSKPVHAAHGHLDGFDAAISFHPTSLPALANSCLWDTHCGTYWSRIYTFECEEPQDWVGAMAREGAQNSHAIARAPGALDAVVMMVTQGRMLRPSMLPQTGAWSLNEAILVAGQATADNLPPDLGVVQYALRAPAIAMQEKVWAILDMAADGIASVTLCTVRKEWVTRTRPGLANRALASVAFRAFRKAGPPVWGEAARGFARELQRSIGVEPSPEDPFPDAIQTLTPPAVAEERIRAQIPPWQTNYTSDDYVEYTWHCPTVRLYVGRPQLRAPRPGWVCPPWAYNALGGVPACIDPMWEKGAEVTALTFLELLEDPAALAACRSEFERRTGGGVGGAQWLAPLLPPDFRAPVHHRWPEYVTTPRGEEYSIPDAARA
jgi:aminobenzoyl-glutamate utilization protein B